jgi:hypothetical protein
VVADNKAGGLFLDGPRGREAAISQLSAPVLFGLTRVTAIFSGLLCDSRAASSFLAGLICHGTEAVAAAVTKVLKCYRFFRLSAVFLKPYLGVDHSCDSDRDCRDLGD